MAWRALRGRQYPQTQVTMACRGWRTRPDRRCRAAMAATMVCPGWKTRPGRTCPRPSSRPRPSLRPHPRPRTSRACQPKPTPMHGMPRPKRRSRGSGTAPPRRQRPQLSRRRLRRPRRRCERRPRATWPSARSTPMMPTAGTSTAWTWTWAATWTTTAWGKTMGKQRITTRTSTGSWAEFAIRSRRSTARNTRGPSGRTSRHKQQESAAPGRKAEAAAAAASTSASDCKFAAIFLYMQGAGARTERARGAARGRRRKYRERASVCTGGQVATPRTPHQAHRLRERPDERL
mmetsp:Transcript_5910/g.23390  ORF Transcript_5910/g.23390 Transcript_5910/m.23390 type:complete len:290 (+) Transcript_5910:864-1733(+)